jgi:hypothetical protein
MIMTATIPRSCVVECTPPRSLSDARRESRLQTAVARIVASRTSSCSGTPPCRFFGSPRKNKPFVINTRIVPCSSIPDFEAFKASILRTAIVVTRTTPTRRDAEGCQTKSTRYSHCVTSQRVALTNTTSESVFRKRDPRVLIR